MPGLPRGTHLPWQIQLGPQSEEFVAVQPSLEVGLGGGLEQYQLIGASR